MMKYVKIVICSACGGLGRKMGSTCKEAESNQHHRCHQCDGDGRMKEITKITLERIDDEHSHN